MLREKLMTDMLNRFPCLATIRTSGGRTWINRENDPFLQDENYRSIVENEYPEDLKGWQEIGLSVSSGPEIKTAVYNEENPVLYLLSMPEDGAYKIVLGPFSRIEVDSRMIHAYCRKHGFRVPVTEKIPMFSAFEVLDYLCIAHEMMEERDVSYEESNEYLPLNRREADRSRIVRELMKEGDLRSHAPYDFERQFEQAIVNGDRQGLSKLTGNINPTEIGKMSENGLKQLEYSAVALVTLVSRIAIRAGVNEVLAYRLSDHFLQQISASFSIESYYRICEQITETYMEEIQKARSDRSESIYVDRAKNHIRNNRNKPLTVSSVARDIGVSSSYLSALFREYEAYSVKKFILQTKLEGAANMLLYSDYEITDISEYFCFSSPSHFASKFREFYGCTPSEYRKR